jgi:hypothetical protein
MGSQRGRRDEDSHARRAFRFVHKREPSQAELEAYKRDRHLERLRSFPRHWLTPDNVAELEAADAEAAAKAAHAPQAQ